MSTLNISLPEQMREYVRCQILSGRYSTPSEYFRDLLRRDQARAERDRINVLLEEALRSRRGRVRGDGKFWKRLNRRASS